MDNLAAHKADGVRQAIQAAGCELLYLPPYSPDFNPIENAFSKLKTLLRAKAERSVDGLRNTVGESSSSSSHRNAPTTSRQPDMTAI